MIGLSYCGVNSPTMTEWPHLQDIQGSESDLLQGKTVGIAVCGSVAAIEIHRVARRLMRHGAQVQFFLTEAAGELVSATSLGWCTGRPVVQRLTARCEHLEFFGVHGTADLLLIAPATANTLGKIAMGLDDNAVTTCITTALGSKVPILCAPGMHAPMMCHPAVRRNLETLAEMGVRILSSSLSEGKQKMMGTEEMVAEVLRALSPGLLRGKKVLITGGPTREYLDPARCLTNPSSGLTACLLAGEAHRLGAEVELIYGPGSVQPPGWVPVRRVDTGEQMLQGVRDAVQEREPDIVVSAAAVSDFAPAHSSEEKRATSLGEFELLLKPTPKIIDWIRRHVPQALLVAFKAASSRNDEQLLSAIQPYLAEDRADLVVGNSVVQEGQGFESSTNRYLVCTKNSEPIVLEKQSKARLSVMLWESIVRVHRSRASS